MLSFLLGWLLLWITVLLFFLPEGRLKDIAFGRPRSPKRN